MATELLSPAKLLQVFDDAFPPALAGLDVERLGSYRRADGARTPTEHFVESLLRELGETCEAVEYWGRNHWSAVVAHCDIDERAARETGELRYPSSVIIAYLEVERGLRAPTVLWTPCGDGDALCAVPAVTGRLLRFDGEMLHAVPQPLRQHFVSAAAAEEEDAAAASRAHHVRRVLVVNCWPERAPDDDEPDVGTGAACAAETTEGGAHEERRCHPFADWCPIALVRCPTSHTAVAVGADGCPDVATQLSTPMFGTTRPLVTTVDAPSWAVEAIHESAKTPYWLPLCAAACAAGAPGRKRARDAEPETVAGTG